MTFSMDDYVPVVDRLAEAYIRWPELRLWEHPAQVVVVDGQSFVASTVTAHRSPDDTHPAQATAWEPYPGKTSFTRNSEMMNAATSAVGRVLALMGIAAKKSIASRDEVRNRQTPPPGIDRARAQNTPRRPEPPAHDDEPPPWADEPPAEYAPRSTHTPPSDTLASTKQLNYLNTLLKKAGKPQAPLSTSKAAASRLIDELSPADA
jgi:hypothetical protein